MTFEERASQALGEWMKGPPIELGPISRFQLWCVFANLQLALRNPANGGAPANEAHAFATYLQAEKFTDLPPELAAIAELGWNKRADQ